MAEGVCGTHFLGHLLKESVPCLEGSRVSVISPLCGGEDSVLITRPNHVVVLVVDLAGRVVHLLKEGGAGGQIIYISVSKVARYAFLSASRWHAGLIRSLRIKMVLKMERINAVLITIVRHNGVVSSVTMDGAAGVVGA